ncbi:MAG: SUMF1/EgtB/PvdO family nonheme iron enzyme, partial [Bacteroidales bacterium]|nr:SUMF1/EgtB/PvdO family nonheme iron enzyme [Bacteroidales bacterium]
PYGMVFIPAGSFVMGPSDEDIAFIQNSGSKTVTVDAFWMDETEITNNEYRQFVYWVRDSLLRQALVDDQLEEHILKDREDNPIMMNKNGQESPRINWNTRIDYQDENGDVQAAVERIGLYYTGDAEFFGRKQLAVEKLIYSYYWIDLQQAAKRTNRFNHTTQEYEGQVVNPDGTISPIEGRQSFVFKKQIPVYPDTLVWISDFTYSFNEPYANLYFYHPSYDNYPLVGVNWEQANAFSIWRTQYLNSSLASDGQPFVQDYRLPSDGEWEYAARGNLDQSMYPWGGPYTRNQLGCFVANFKPLRGNYIDDGSLIPARVGSFSPNEYGLYDMAGNVAEWTSSAYDVSAFMFTHNMNPDYKYNARPDDPPVMKRKIIRGGSWKDVAYYLQVSVRDYEYQDTAKSYIGFRCVRSYLGSK